MRRITRDRYLERELKSSLKFSIKFYFEKGRKTSEGKQRGRNENSSSTSRIYVSRKWIYLCNYVSEINVNPLTIGKYACNDAQQFFEPLHWNVIVKFLLFCALLFRAQIIWKLIVLETSWNDVATELKWNANCEGLKDRGFYSSDEDLAFTVLL